MAEVFVAGVGMTAFGKRHEPLPELMAEAAEKAIKGSKRQTFDAMYIGVMNPEEFSTRFASTLASTARPMASTAATCTIRSR
jgi:acetyl-CoA acetyltransferase